MRPTLLLVLVFVVGVVSVPVRATTVEQTVVPLTPPTEERIEALGGPEAVEGVVAADPGRVEAVEPAEPPSPVVKTASTVGKVVLASTAAVASMAAMVALLLI